MDRASMTQKVVEALKLVLDVCKLALSIVWNAFMTALSVS